MVRPISRYDTQDSITASGREIDVKQNWLARLFRVKPAMAYICMKTSRKCARQEIVIMLRSWRKYGIKGIQVDKRLNIVLGQVGTKNCESTSDGRGWLVIFLFLNYQQGDGTRG